MQNEPVFSQFRVANQNQWNMTGIVSYGINIYCYLGEWLRSLAQDDHKNHSMPQSEADW